MASRLWHYYQYLTSTDILDVRGNNHEGDIGLLVSPSPIAGTQNVGIERLQKNRMNIE